MTKNKVLEQLVTASSTVQKSRYVDPASQIDITMERQCLRWWTAHPPSALSELRRSTLSQRSSETRHTNLYKFYNFTSRRSTHTQDRTPERMPVRTPEDIPTRMRDCQIACQTKCHKICQIKCQKISRIECQKICLIGQSNIWQPIFQINH